MYKWEVKLFPKHILNKVCHYFINLLKVFTNLLTIIHDNVYKMNTFSQKVNGNSLPS